METTNSEMSVKQMQAQFAAKVFDVAEAIGEENVSFEIHSYGIIATITTSNEINLKELAQLAGKTEVTIMWGEDGFQIEMREDF